MNAVEIEEAVSELFEQPFDAVTFSGAFLESFGNKPTVIKRLQNAASLSDIEGAVLQRNNIHFKVCSEGQVNTVFNQLKSSPATTKNKTKFILATDGVTVEAEDLSDDAPLVCDYKDFPNHFGYFLPLAGIETVKQIRDSSFDIRATSRLNRLYIELLKDNPEWGTADNRHEMNHFMARLIFCFFAEDTDIIRGERLFTTTIEQMSERDSSNTNQIISEIFRALNTKTADRASEKLPRWTEQFPYVNGGLFAGKVDVPRFSKIARSYLLHIGSLDWTKINPDIFGSMIQAVADDEERGSLGMHYTSVPNILKVLNPLFLDDLREQLEVAGDNARTLLNLRKRIAKIRVFDPACGSGNFLVISYKEMRSIENEINLRRGDAGRKTDIPLTNFRGIELRDFPAEIARLALIIAEYQCNLLYRGQKEAIDDFLPLDSQNWITCGNALRMDWLGLCPPTGSVIKINTDDLFVTYPDQAQIDYENEGSETYICGNPPYLGAKKKSDEQKKDLELHGIAQQLDYVSAFIIKAADFLKAIKGKVAIVATSSICQGEQVSSLWPRVLKNARIAFAYRPFKWSNSAANNAGVFCTIIGLDNHSRTACRLFDENTEKTCASISPYLVSGDPVICHPTKVSISNLNQMVMGSNPVDGGNLVFEVDFYKSILERDPAADRFIRPYYGTQEFLHSTPRYCIWIEDKDLDLALTIPSIAHQIEECRIYRLGAGRDAKKAASKPHKFCYSTFESRDHIIIGKVIGEKFRYVPADFMPAGSVIGEGALTIYGKNFSEFAIINSTLHRVWAEAVSGRIGNGIRYGNTIVYNTFAVPALTEKNKSDLMRCAEDILIARQSHFPETIAGLYRSDSMPQNLRDAHDRNDEVLERIYIGRRFKNDTERLEKLFELYAKMTSKK